MTFSLTILGSSSALPTSKRFPTAQILNLHEHFFLIDCGEGAQIQLRRQKIKLSKINHIFISHLHGDHYYGLFGLISSFSLLGRKNDLHIFCPQNLDILLNTQFSHTGHPLSFNIIYHFISSNIPELIYEDKHITINTLPMKHRIPAYGFLFREKTKLKNIIKCKIEEYKIPIPEIIKIKQGYDFIASTGEIIPNQKLTIEPPEQRSYAYCSDTKFNEEIITLIKNADLLYHEATFAGDKADEAEITYHSTAIQAATIASMANVKKRLIGHFSARYKDVTPLVDEARAVFENTFAAEDGMIINI
ncbi:MAG: ribonuclease Z [Bacteroidia bacterium]|nr:ribonuclease Z [Bacteroidia bacterium]